MLNLTKNIYTFPHLNKRFGFELFCSYFKSNTDHFINIEIIGEELYGKFNINIDMYSEDGAIRKSLGNINIDGKTFDGITANQIRLPNNYLLSQGSCHIRIYPTNEYLVGNLYRAMTLVVVGINFSNRRKHVDRLVVGDLVTLRLEPHNEFDKFAVKVMDSADNHIGYLAKECAFIYNQHVKDNEVKTTTILKKKRSSLFVKSPVKFIEKDKFLFGE